MSITPNSSPLKHIASGLASGLNLGLDSGLKLGLKLRLKSKLNKPKLKQSASKLSVFSSASAVALALPLSVFALGTSAAPSSAASNPDYFACASDMSASGVSEENAIAACAAARYPESLGACVVDVNEFTGLTADSALLICGRSRRPEEVANCTIDIHEALFESPSTEALQNCGSSLLPERYSSCVIDIAEATETDADEALTQCARAGYRPWTLQPRS